MKVKIKKDGYQVLDINDDFDFNEGDLISKRELNKLVSLVFKKGQIWETEDDKKEGKKKDEWYFDCVSNESNYNCFSWKEIKSFVEIINE
jgi:hypothetical protein